MVSTDFETSPISFTFDPMAGIMVGTTFMKVVCGNANVWGYSCCVVDLIWHMAEAKIDQEAIKDKQVRHPRGLQRTTGYPTLRVPTICIPVVDLTIKIKKETTW